MKTKSWVIITAAVLAVSAIACCFAYSGNSGKLAGVYLDSELIMTIDMSKVSEEYDIPVIDGGNIITVSPEGIWVSEATCPDKICVLHGALDGGAPIVCLPHKLVIKWVDSETQYDAKTGV